jgi:hypothetical protein
MQEERSMTQTGIGSLRYIHPGGQYELDMICPHCGTFAPAKGPKLNPTTVVLLCYRCKKAVMLLYKTIASPPTSTPATEIVDYYPKRSVQVSPHVPKNIGEDYLEAQRCFLAGAWHGCAVMARRCMHSVAEHLNAVGKDLFQQIDDLKARQIITPVLAEQAQHVRVLGKHGAHPFDIKGNQLKELGVDDAQAALDFCEFIFDQVFIQPEKIKASKARLNPPKP